MLWSNFILPNKNKLGKNNIHYLPFKYQFHRSQSQWKTDGPVSHPSIVMWWVCRRFIRSLPFIPDCLGPKSQVPKKRGHHPKAACLQSKYASRYIKIQDPSISFRSALLVVKALSMLSHFGRLGPQDISNIIWTILWGRSNLHLKNGCEIGDVTFVFWGFSKSTTWLVVSTFQPIPKTIYSQIGFISQNGKGWK